MNVRGKAIIVPSVQIGDRIVVVTGKLLRMATVHEEDWLDGEPVGSEQFVATLRAQKVRADIFQLLSETA